MDFQSKFHDPENKMHYLCSEQKQVVAPYNLATTCLWRCLMNWAIYNMNIANKLHTGNFFPLRYTEIPLTDPATSYALLERSEIMSLSRLSILNFARSGLNVTQVKSFPLKSFTIGSVTFPMLFVQVYIQEKEQVELC